MGQTDVARADHNQRDHHLGLVIVKSIQGLMCDNLSAVARETIVERVLWSQRVKYWSAGINQGIYHDEVVGRY